MADLRLPPEYQHRTTSFASSFALIHVLGFAAVLLLLGCHPKAAPVGKSQQKAIQEARRLLESGRIEAAEEAAHTVLKNDWENPDAMLLLGKIHAARGDSEAAFNWLDRIDATSSSTYPQALVFKAHILITDGSLSKAERHLRDALRSDPSNVEAHQTMAELLTTVGRRWESIPHLFVLLRRDMYQTKHLLMLADQESVIDFSAELNRSLKHEPHDPLARLALARIARKNNDVPLALELVKESLAQSPELLEGHATLGHLLIDTDPNAIPQWHNALPESAREFPEIWFVCGRWAESREESQAALRCYGETLRRNPNHRQATYRMARVLRHVGRDGEAADFEARARMLDQLVSAADTLLRDGNAVIELRQAAELTQSLGRLWEAHAWYRQLAAVSPNRAQFDQRRQEIAAQLDQATPLTIVIANPANQLNLASLPLPQFEPGQTSGDARPREESKTVLPRFIDHAAETGLRFQYNNGDDPAIPGWEIYNELGGGIAVLDFDSDGWPDVFLSQGTSWPPPDEPTQDRDRLFHNLQSQTHDVTELALPLEAGFGQGATAGDFDGDGFVDLYVANIGRNRLYQNQGDGTFLDVTDQAEIDTELWTSSCLVADLNGDSLPDLYDVNYLAGDRPFKEICTASGVRQACSPDRFEGEQDQLLLNLGDGRFMNATKDSGVLAANGKGLGIIAADFDQSGRLSLFVANDATPNFFFRNVGEPGHSPQFVESGIASGLAFDSDGRSEACMGVAFDDANRDGQWDMFVTNFHRESNTLYRQLSADQFVDATRREGLDRGNRDFTGFGTQFIDAELDGFPDLVVLNGHIDDLRHIGIPFQMVPRFFANLGEKGFRELGESLVGGYFTQPALGRSLAVLDWNRDGKTDFVATHLDAPAALLINETGDVGHFLKVRLSGTRSSRDAVGAIVQAATSNGSTWIKQLVAGDGYQASNERVITLGLGAATQIDSLRVRWPSGVEETWHSIAANQEIRIIEGGRLVALYTN